MVDEKGRKIEIKEDCFAYRNGLGKDRGNCVALNGLYCAMEVCKFYKPKDEVK